MIHRNWDKFKSFFEQKFWFNFLVSIVLIFKSLKSILIFQRSGLGMKGLPCILVWRPISKEVSSFHRGMTWFWSGPNPYSGPLLNYRETEIIFVQIINFRGQRQPPSSDFLRSVCHLNLISAKVLLASYSLRREIISKDCKKMTMTNIGNWKILPNIVKEKNLDGSLFMQVPWNGYQIIVHDSIFIVTL